MAFGWMQRASVNRFIAGARLWCLDGVFTWRKPLRELRTRWGKPGNNDNWMASRYFDLVRDADDADACVDDKTWADLELPATFTAMDTSVSPVGSQVLFLQLRRYVGAAEVLAGRRAAYKTMQTDAALRETLQRKLLPLQHDHNARIADFIFGALPPPLRNPRLLQAWALASLAMLVAIFVWPALTWIWLVMVAINVITHLRIGINGRTLRDIETLRACLRLAKVADDLGGLDARCPQVPQLAGLRAERANRRRLSRALGWLLVWSTWSGLFPISIVVGLVNFTCLADLVLYARTMRRFAGLRHLLAASFEAVGSVDAAIAIASWLTYARHDCAPTLTDDRVLDIRAGRHPLLADAVPNSIRLDHRSVLVTGSNMAGKTTFIKMLGVNALFAQTLGFCVATAATVPRARVMASIQAAHSVASGKSHYFSEVETVRAFLQRPAGAGRAIFVIDELFSGTNTIERVAIACAVLEALGHDALVLATTHDVELQAQLADRYELCHFEENPDVDGYFDYQLRPGPATARNAIRLLGEVGFPAAVIARAMAHAEAAVRPGVPT